MAQSYLINPRWIDIPEDEIVRQLSRAQATHWHNRMVDLQHYLYSYEGYAYCYSLPPDVIDRLALRLNARQDMTWYQDYNQKAMDYFNETGAALNQAAQYWADVGNLDLPKPEILPAWADGALEDGDTYIAIIGLFHLTGAENSGNHHLFIDLVDEDGNRIYDNNPPLYLYYGWEGMTTSQIQETSPVRVDKPLNEPGANVGMEWGQILFGFYINNIVVDRFKGVHIRYGDNEPDGSNQAGNYQGHHSHYVVLQKRIYHPVELPPEPEPPIPEPEPEPPVPEPIPVVGHVAITVSKAWLMALAPDVNGNVTFVVEIK